MTGNSKYDGYYDLHWQRWIEGNLINIYRHRIDHKWWLYAKAIYHGKPILIGGPWNRVSLPNEMVLRRLLTEGLHRKILEQSPAVVGHLLHVEEWLRPTAG